ncbi:MAG TPA: phenylalanine--tRNA ligase subunit beta, partial [Bacteroidales bacterium]|nr:phenylalanine--tRNA ligase subunit beta [Bacteroidales bacterium]
MKISCSWIREYVNTGLTAGEISEILTSTGLEVETIEPWESIRGGLAGVVSGKVITCEKHPDADKLKVCMVDVADGQGLLNIVCGAPNVEAGQMVWVARVGAVLYPAGSPDPLEIKKAKIRGVVSEGMICAEDELGIGSSHAGIMVLPDGTSPGLPAAAYYKVLSDQVFEVGLTPNRSDAMSHIGVARDLAAAVSFRRKLAVPLNLPGISHPKSPSGELPVKVLIENREACRRYTGITIEGVTVAESPEWLMNRLKSIGIKPINNVVDITNFVLHETGHPLHAFDYDRIEGATIEVKNLPEGTPFITLDGTERKLTSDDLMICDSRKPLCIAGVYGGLHSGVTAETRNLFLESAWFD